MEQLNIVISGYGSSEERSIQSQTIENNIADRLAAPVADPMKRPTVPAFKVRPARAPHSSPRQTNYMFTTSRTRSPPQISQPRIPQPAIMVPAAPSLTELASTASSSRDISEGKISDKAVFRGLHVATAAAADEDVDKWIEEMTGYGARKFLADLSAFDGLGVNSLAGEARRAAVLRKGEVKEKILEKKGDGVEICDLGNDGAVSQKETYVEKDAGFKASVRLRGEAIQVGGMMTDKQVVELGMRGVYEGL